MVPKKPVIRQCVGCRTRQEKDKMFRIVRTPTRKVKLDDTGREPGRGTYLCPRGSCLEQALKKDRLGRALQSKINHEVVEMLRQKIEKHDPGKYNK